MASPALVLVDQTGLPDSPYGAHSLHSVRRDELLVRNLADKQ
jgi:hypothetical protein